MQLFSSRKLPALILLLVPLLLYAPTIRFPFVWDDGSQIVNNEVLRDPSRVFEILTSSTFDRGGGELTGAFYRPLVSLSYFVNYQLWGLNPTGFRIFQLLLHALTGLLIFFIFKKILSPSGGDGTATKVSFVTALLFAVHPANVESVVYIGCVGEVLYTLFALLAFALFVAEKNENQTDAVPIKKIVLFFFLVFLGILAKETAIVIIPITLWYLWIFVRPRLATWLAFAGGTAVTIGLYLWIRLGIAHIPMLIHYPSQISQASFGERLLTIPFILFRYVVTLIAPVRLLIYQNDVVHSVTDIRFWGSSIMLALITVLIVRFLKFKESKWEYFFLGWFVLGIGPVLNVLGLDMTIAERWLYFPSVGFLFFTVLIAARAAKHFKTFANRLPYLFFLVLVLFSARTLVRANDWRSAAELYKHDIRYVTDSFELMSNHALQLIDDKRYDEAQALLERALVLNPDWFRTYINLGVVYQLQGKTEQAVDRYLEAIQRFNVNFGYTNLAALLIDQKRYDEARDVLDLGQRMFPTFKRIQFLTIILEYKTDEKEKAVARLQELLKKGVLDRDINELKVQLDQFNIPLDALVIPGN